MKHLHSIAFGLLQLQKKLTLQWRHNGRNGVSNQRKHQSSASLAFVRGIHRSPANSPHEWPVTRKMFPFDDAIMIIAVRVHYSGRSPVFSGRLLVQPERFQSTPAHRHLVGTSNIHRQLEDPWKQQSMIISHYNNVMMSAMASQITGVSIVYSTVCSGANQREEW